MDSTTATHRQAAVVKMENPIRASPVFDYFPKTGGLLDYNHCSSSELVDDSKGALLGGFMELLGMQNFSSFELDNAITSTSNTMLLQVPPPVLSSYPRGPGRGALTSQAGLQTMPQTADLVVVVPEEDEEVSPDMSINNNGPATPNSSSISSEDHSSGAPRNTGDHHHHHHHEQISRSAVDYHEYDTEKHEHPTHNTSNNKQLKAKKTREKKRQKDPRFAFMTKSEVDHLEDGYRWRKYGQKAVKNSPFPRSYYRCTSASCNVKKRVERSFHDPSIVVTTYEGQHIHPSPITHHRLPPVLSPSPTPAAAGHTLILPQDPNCFSSTTIAGVGLPIPMPMQMPLSLQHQPQHLNKYNLTLPMHCGSTSTNINSTAIPLERGLIATPKPSATALLRGAGLLQDVVSPP